MYFDGLKTEYFKSVFDKLQEFANTLDLCDVVLVCEEEEFPAHRVLLSAASEFFKSLFTTDMKEKNQSVIELKGITHTALGTCLQFIYYGHVDVCEDQLGDILHASSLLQLWKLRNLCFKYIETHLSERNCLRMFQLANAFDFTGNITTNILVNHVEFLFSHPETFDIGYNIFKTILTSDELNITNEIVLFEALINWTQYNFEDRNQYFCDLLSAIRLPLMPINYLSNKVATHNHIAKCTDCKTYLEESLSFHLNQVEDKNTINKQLKSRRSTHFAIVPDNCKDMQIISAENNTCKPVNVPHPPIQTCSECIVVHNNTIYVLGAKNNKCVYSFDYKSDKEWKELPSMQFVHVYRHVCSTMVYKNNLLVIGGANFKEYISKVESYDIENQQWGVLPNMLTARCEMSAAVLNGNIYVIGGYNGAYLSSVEKYDFLTNRWSTVSSLNRARCYASVVAYKQKLFVAGGYGPRRCTELSSVECFNEKTKTWTEVANMNSGRAFHGSCVVDDKLFVVGGWGYGSKALFEQWDEKSKTWIMSEEIDDKNEHCKVFAVNE